MAQSLAARGIGTTGTGAILSGLTPSLVGSQQAGLRTSAYQGAQSQAQNAIQKQLEALQGTSVNPQTGQMIPSQGQQYFAGGLDAFLPYLTGLLHGHGAARRSQGQAQQAYNFMAPSMFGRG